MANGYIVCGDGTGTATNAQFSAGFSPPVAPIVYSTNTYIIAGRETSGTLGAYLTAFKQIAPVPGGIPYFTALDTANSPFLDNANAQVYYPPSGGSLAYAAYGTALEGTLNLRTFNFASETWGTVVASGGPSPKNGNHGLVHRTNGDWVVFFDSANGPETIDTYYQVYNGTAWGTATIITNVSTSSSDSAALSFVTHKESNNAIAVWWNQIYFSESYGTNHQYLTVLSSANALTTHYNWQNRTNGAAAWQVSGIPCYNVGEDKWVAPITDALPGANAALVLINISPTDNPNAITTNKIVGGVSITNVAYPRVNTDPVSNDLYFIWINNYDGATGNISINWLQRAADGTSTWAVTTTTDTSGSTLYIPTGMTYVSSNNTLQNGTFTKVLYEETVDSLLPSPVVSNPEQDLIYFSVGSSTLRAVSNPQCDFQYYFSEAAIPEPPILACPVNNTIILGSTYTGTMVVSSGTPPYTFTLLA